MKLSDEWKVSRDKYQFILEHLSPVTDRDSKEKKLVWQVVGYYGSVEQLARTITLYLTRDALAAETLQEFIDTYYEALDMIKVIVSEAVVGDSDIR